MDIGPQKSPHVRLFVAWRPDDVFRACISEFRQNYSNAAHIRWVQDHNLHLTLFFIGDVPETSVGIITKLTGDSVPDLQPLSLKPGGFTLMGKPRKPSMIWYRFNTDKEFTASALTICEKINDHFRAEQKFSEPIPHITVARLGRRFDTGSVRTDNDTNLPDALIRKIGLWKSVKVQGRTEYEVLSEWEL